MGAADTFIVEKSTIEPTAAAADYTISYNVTMKDDSALPDFITYVDSPDFKFTLDSSDNADAGTYDILVTCIATGSNGATTKTTDDF